MKMAEQYLYSPIDVAKVMGISRSQVYNLMNEGHLDSVHIGKSRRISRQHVHDYIHKLEGVI